MDVHEAGNLALAGPPSWCVGHGHPTPSPVEPVLGSRKDLFTTMKKDRYYDFSDRYHTWHDWLRSLGY